MKQNILLNPGDILTFQLFFFLFFAPKLQNFCDEKQEQTNPVFTVLHQILDF